jgi:hypothetical protein
VEQHHGRRKISAVRLTAINLAANREFHLLHSRTPGTFWQQMEDAESIGNAIEKQLRKPTDSKRVSAAAAFIALGTPPRPLSTTRAMGRTGD